MWSLGQYFTVKWPVSGLVSSVYLPTKDREKTLFFPDGQWDPPRPLPSYGRLWDINQTINSIWSNVKLSECLEGCPFHDQRLTGSKIYDDRVNICWTEQKKLILVSLQDVFYVSCWRGTRCFPGKMKVSLATLLTLSVPHYVVVGDQLSCIIELLGMPPQKLLDQSKRAKNFISSKGRLRCRILTRDDAVPAGYPRYCTATTLPDGTTVLNGGRSRRGKPRGPPGSRELQTALKGCDDPLFLDFIRRCLEWDPAARMTPNAALRHAWLRRRLPRPPQVGRHVVLQQIHSVYKNFTRWS